MPLTVLFAKVVYAFKALCFVSLNRINPRIKNNTNELTVATNINFVEILLKSFNLLIFSSYRGI